MSETSFVPAQEVAECPLSFGQRVLWFLHQSAPEIPVYHINIAGRIQSNIDISVLRRSLQALVDRHPPLRTSFSASSGEPMQRIHKHMEVCFREEDASTWESVFLNERVAHEAHRPFNLERDPLLQATLFTRAPTDHILLLKFHHIITDYWSSSMFLHELGLMYSAEQIDSPSSLPPIEAQFSDFVRWQTEMLEGPEARQQLAYWKKQLAGEPPLLHLPADKTGLLNQARQGAVHTFTLGEQLTRSLQSLAQREDVSLFALLLAAFQVLLHRYTHQEDILVGSFMHGRSRPEFKKTFGYFVNTVVLRTDLSGDPTFTSLLAQVHQGVLDARRYSDYPFPLLVERLQGTLKTHSLSSLQAMFNMTKPIRPGHHRLMSFPRGQAGGRADLGAFVLESFPIGQHYTPFDLTLTIEDSGTTLYGLLEYNTHLFSPATIARMLRHLQTLLQGIVADPGRRLSALPLMSMEERQQLLIEWNATQRAYPTEACIQDVFEAQVEQTPDAVAVVFEDEQLTYRELNERANQLAHFLQARGVGPEVLVGICVERSLEMMVGLLGILKAGGAYLPLDPSYPKERLAFMLRDAQAPILLTQQRLVAHLPELDAQVLCMDRVWGEIAQAKRENILTETVTGNLAYILYTSGSTGQPKGVMISHQALVNYTLDVTRKFKLSCADRILQFASLSFDVAVEEIFPPWSAGAAVVLCDEQLLLSPSDLLSVIEQQRVTVIELPTAYWHELAFVLARTGKRLPSSLRLVLVGGERALPEPLAIWQQLGVPFMNVYGPTETTVTSTVYEEGSGAEDWEVSSGLPIGRPIANTHIYLLDQHLLPVPVGLPGELYIGGSSLARGYLGRPDVTAEHFIPHPFSIEPGARLYKTGDLARYLPDGNLVFLGRIDDQVKLRGFRIELGEIEAVLGQHPSLQEAIVLAREDPPGNKRLVAYLHVHRSSAPSVHELRDYLKERLPEYMIPSAFVPLEAFPLTPNGKINRHALPLPEGRSLEVQVPQVAPRTHTEELLVGLWVQLLGRHVGVYDNFFEVGGHSLLATQLISRVRDAFRVVLPLRDLFEAPTVAELAGRIETAQRAKLHLQAPALVPVSRDGELPLSFAQQRLWFLDQLAPGNPVYNVPVALRLTGALRTDVLERSLTQLVRRHESLRTIFATKEGRPIQIICPPEPLPLSIVEMAPSIASEREAEVGLLVTQEALQPFDLTHGPVVRATLLRLSKEEHVLLLTMHHIVSDGWSAEIFVRELAALYDAFSTGKPFSLPELLLQYVDFARWQQQWLQGEVLEAHLKYWKQQLKGAPTMLQLPTDHLRPAVQTFRGATQRFMLPEWLTRQLKALSQREEVTLFMLVLAAFQVLLLRYTWQEDIVVGSPIANRTQAEMEGLIGFFVNMLVLRTDLSGDPSFRKLLRRVREVALGAYEYQDLPFEKLVEELQPERDLSYQPLFQVVFAMQNTSMSALEVAGLVLNPLEVKSETAKFDLMLNLWESSDGLTGRMEYNTDLFEATTIARMVGHFRTLLEGIIANPEQHLSELPLLTEQEQQQLLIEWNAPQVE